MKDKTLKILGFLAISALFVLAAGTQERVIPTTSAFWRRMLTNETAQGSVSMLGINGTNGGGGGNITIGGIAYINNQLYLTNPIVIGDDTTIVSNLVVQGDQTNYGSLYLPGLSPNLPLHTDGASKVIAGLILETDLGLTDLTTANASITKHGFMPKGDNNVNHFFNGANALTGIPDGALSANVPLINGQNNLTASNFLAQASGFVSLQSTTNVWGNAPSGNLDMNVEDQNYVTSGNVTITGIINKASKTTQTVTLTIYNSDSVDHTFTLPNTILSKDGFRTYTMTKAQDFIISIRYHPGTGHTNSVQCANF